MLVPTLLIALTLQNPVPPASVEEATRQIQAIYDGRSSQGFSGVLCVWHGDRKLLGKAYGMRDREAKLPMTEDTVFDIGSIVKPLTAMAIYKLEAAGKLKISDPISKYFSEVPPDKQTITVEHLLGHRAGLVDVVGGDYELQGREDLVRKVLAAKLIGPIDAKYVYSNAGFSLLAAIIEKVTGLPYEAYVHEAILRPAGAEKVGYKIPSWPKDQLAVGYRGEKRWGSPLDHLWMEDGPSWNLRGNGGMLATAEQLFRAMHTPMVSEKVLPKTARDKFNGRIVRQRGDKGRLAGALGGNGYFNSVFIWLERADLTIVIFSNVSEHRAEKSLPDILTAVEPLL